jgi:hypothetical protein
LEFLKYWPSSRDFNKLVIKAKMHAKTHFFFEVFFVVWKYDVILFFVRLGRMHKNIFLFFKTSFFFLKVLTKTRYFNIGFCIFSNIKKILLDINQNDIKRETCKITNKYFWIFLLTKKKNGPDLTQPSWAGSDLAHILWAGLSPAAWAGLMCQPVTNKRAGYLCCAQ